MSTAQRHPVTLPGGRADEAYRRVRETAATLLAGSRSAAATPVPTCPEWSVADLVTHLVEVCARVHGRVTGAEPVPVPSGAVPELLELWERLSRPVEEFLDGPMSLDRGIMVMDAFTHELDLRRALDTPPPVDHPALPIAMDVVVKGFAASLEGHGLPPVAAETEYGRWVASAGEPAATMSGPWYEVYLALAGRRSAAQIRSLRWSVDPGRWLPAFTWGPFRMPEPAEAAPRG
ncbi:maleylpyruvate isomerase family mycothiol-dependent enzyme [Micromonospora halophytica]|uniref:TIGR03083 family protein n=1 Tax=Micromonospora halophytica TaxID=47864 RepID=A0A1C5IKW6_9ACTN|nr:maleylpyruvate isomerase family mycothiol-dependent enzyme [Micromonospora halophytica]SCG58990.1 TIGR03083 family protein [Micromonospora halophytica]